MNRDLPEVIYFNPLSITDKEPTHGREGAYQIYARTHSAPGDAEYALVRVLPREPREWMANPELKIITEVVDGQSYHHGWIKVREVKGSGNE